MHVATPPDKPLMLFDRDCGFCRRWVVRWRAVTGDKIDYESFQDSGGKVPEIPFEQLRQAVHLIEPDGHVTRGAAAAYRAFAIAKRHRWLNFAYRHVPGFAAASESVYRFVADHRNSLDKLDRWALGEGPELPSYFITRGFFLRSLGLIYLIAFLSLWSQINGLIGSNGILPVGQFLNEIRAALPPERWHHDFPTLCWFNSSDAFLQVLCGAGTALSLLLMAGIFPSLVCALLFITYLSLTIAGQDFLGFQWDALLLEAGFLAIFYSPLQWRLSLAKPTKPPATITWMYRWLAFRVMFLSGILKWTSRDVAWLNFKAMGYHYETQPLPAWTSWYAHWLPRWFQSWSAIGVFIVEGIIPVLYFLPRRLRFIGFWATVIFQCLIMATGNFGFFNLLTIVVCIPLLDDAVFPKRIYQRIRSAVGTARTLRWKWPDPLTAAIALALFILSLGPVILAFNENATFPAWYADAHRWARPYQVANGYGLFRVMTTERPEIIFEASMDGQNWQPYVFKYKPGDVMRRPAYCIPHMPRLDWQMWFAALYVQDRQVPGWIESFARRLLGASPQVLALLEHAPFSDTPPAYVRAVLYDYHFTDPDTRHRTGAWWRRDARGVIFVLRR